MKSNYQLLKSTIQTSLELILYVFNNKKRVRKQLMQKIKRINVDTEKVRMAIQTGIPLTITTYTLPPEMEDYITDVLSVFLAQLNQEHMTDSLVYCVKELVNNAKKANTKRVYFVDKKLDLFNKEEYDKGMENFKLDTFNNIKYYLEEQRKLGYYIKVLFQVRNNKIKIEIKNKAELTLFEYKRIHDKITRAQQYNSVEEGITALLDESEGAGLGLVILILILRKIGISEENYQIISENGETITRVFIPFTEKLALDVSSLTKDFVNLIEGLPEFPDNIIHINHLINDPKSKMSDIASEISGDVSLTGELLKLVNSSAYVLNQPCKSIGEAVKLVGLRGIRNLLFSLGSMKNLMVESNETTKKMWDTSYRTAFYSYNLARNFCKGGDRTLIEDSYVCGLLQDMGKIVFESARPETLNKIKLICEKRGISSLVFENLIAGLNHGEIGALIAEKWNFPPVLVNVIRYHHSPEDAPEEFRKLTEIVYIADIIVMYSDGMIEYDQISNKVLEDLGIDSEEQFQGIVERLTDSYCRN